MLGSRRSPFVFVMVFGMLSGCVLDRSGTGADDSGPASPDAGRMDAAVGDAGVRLDGGGDGGPVGIDADTPGDDAGRDGGFDAGGCADGTVDLDGDPSNGCECVVAPQRCEGVDDDCDGTIDEGCTCSAGASRPCGTSDVGECRRGSQACESGAWGACVGAVEPTAEVCNNRDDDCDGVTDTFSEPCGTSMGICTEGTRFCAAGTLGGCTGIPAGTEICDLGRLDEDCDGVSNEDCECDGSMMGTCTMGACTGTRTCNGSGRWGACVIAAIETCDGTDSDCNGVIDDGSAICEVATGCDQVRLASGVYLLCYQKPGSDRRRGWTAARDYCASFGYHLVTIDDGAENSALMSAAMARVDGDWWIGINDEDGDSMFSWVSGRSRFEAWRMDEPDRGECGVIDTAENDWESKGCGGSRGFICEAPGP